MEDTTHRDAPVHMHMLAHVPSAVVAEDRRVGRINFQIFPPAHLHVCSLKDHIGSEDGYQSFPHIHIHMCGE